MADVGVSTTEGLEERRFRRAREIAEREGLSAPKTPIQTMIPAIGGPGQSPKTTTPGEELARAFPEEGELEMKMQRARVLYDRETGEYEDDEDYAARYVGQESLGGPSMGPGLRAELAFWGDTPEERQAVFELARPNGEMLTVPGTEITVFRETPDQPFRKVDQGVLESLRNSNFMRESVADVSEFMASQGLQMAAEYASLLGAKTKIPAAGRATKNLFRLIFGSFLGGETREALQKIRGTSREPFSAATRRSATESLGSGLGAAVGGLLAGTVSRAAGRAHAGVVGAKPGAAEAIAATERIMPKVSKDPRWYHFGKPKYTQLMIPTNQLTDQPLIQRIGRVAAAIMPTLNRYILNIDQQIKGVARSFVDKSSRDLFMKESVQRLEQSSKNIIDFTTHAIKFKGMHPRLQGKTIQKMIADWWEASGRNVDHLYAVARGLHDPEFDLTPALKDAEEILARKVTPGKPITVGTGEDAEEIIPLLRFGRAPSARLQDFITRLKAIDEGLPDPDLPPGTTIPSRTDRIRGMIQELDDMARPGAGGEREPDLLAKRLSAKLRQVLDSPIGGDEEFNRAWAKAQRGAKKRFETREHLTVIEAIDSDTPSGIVNKLLMNPDDPATIDRLIVMRKATSKEGWRIIRDEFKGRVLSKMKDPDKLDSFLDGMHPQVKRMLIDPAEERVVRAQAGKIRQLYKTNIPKAAERQSRRRAFLSDLIDRSDTAGVDAMTEFCKGDGALYSSFQHAIMDEAIERSMRFTKEGVERINGKAMRETLAKFRELGILDLLHSSQVRQLEDVQAIQLILDRAVEDAGTSLTGAATATGFFAGATQALGRSIHMLGLSRILTSPAVAKFLIGAGEKEAGYSTRRMALLVGSIATHMTRSIEKEEQGDEGFDKLKSATSIIPKGGIDVTVRYGQ